MQLVFGDTGENYLSAWTVAALIIVQRLYILLRFDHPLPVSMLFGRDKKESRKELLGEIEALSLSTQRPYRFLKYISCQLH